MSDRYSTVKSSSDSDPLLRAVADGDPNCPDGRMLSALGDLFRRHAQPPNETDDLSADILAKLKDVEHADVNEIDAIDAFYDGAADGSATNTHADPTLDRLAGLARSVGPRRVDVTNAVLRRIRASSRLASVLGTDDERETVDGRSRWRIISAVIAGHVAALLAFAIFQIGFHAGQETPVDGTTLAVIGDDSTADGQGGTIAGNRNGLNLKAPELPPNLPATWGDIRGLGTDLFLLRRFPELRSNARQLFGMQASETSVARSVAWIRGRLDAKTGTFTAGDDASNVTNTHDERALATHALATLVLLGEGLGDKAHSADTRRSLDWLRIRLGDTELAGDGSGTDHAFTGLSQVTSGLVSLALVEGALLYGDLGLRSVAESTLTTLDRGLPMQAGAAGLGGFTLLALETAQQGGMRVPGRLLQQARRSLARSLPTQDADAGRVGLAAFARYIYGLGGNSSTRLQVGQLGNMLPGSTAGRPDPLGWFFATLALREADGSDWQKWAGALEGQLVPLVQADGHVTADTIRYGETGGDVFATSLVVLNLQAPYRYLPLAPTIEK
jgi:hypothetical protein